MKAVANLKHICEAYMQGNYELEVIDIYQQPLQVRKGNITTTPSLVKLAPLPVLKLSGDLSDTKEVVKQLNLVHS
jgi:circadian clock protein KaiB